MLPPKDIPPFWHAIFIIMVNGIATVWKSSQIGYHISLVCSSWILSRLHRIAFMELLAILFILLYLNYLHFLFVLKSFALEVTMLLWLVASAV
jgi:hypothetical protein